MLASLIFHSLKEWRAARGDQRTESHPCVTIG